MPQILWGTQILCWMLLTQNTKDQQQERLTLCLTASISRMPTEIDIGQKLCLPNCQYFQTCSTQQERNLNSRDQSMGIFLDDLEQVYNRTQIASEEAHQNSSKTGWNNAKSYPSHSMSVLEQFWNFSGNNYLWKILLFCGSFRLWRMQW